MISEGNICPGCGLSLPKSASARYSGYYSTSPECWGVYTEVLAKEFSDALLFGQVHQLTVDAYAAQHAGGRHPDKSVIIHLCGLHFMLDRGLPPAGISPLHRRLAGRVREWPHLQPPGDMSTLTVSSVAQAESREDHARRARDWAAYVWRAWSPHHQTISRFVSEFLK
ncbi:MAG: DUF5946 family protein [Candidatus Aminicenantales bacterium]